MAATCTYTSFLAYRTCIQPPSPDLVVVPPRVTGVVRACMQAWQAWKLSLVRQEGVDASSFCLAGGRVFCTVDDGVDMKVLGTVNKKGEFQSGEDAVVRIGMGWDGDEKDAADAAAAATTAERSERGK